MSYYHGSDQRITVLDRPVCLTDEDDIAASYAQGAGWLHAIDLDGAASIADEDEILSAARAALLADWDGDGSLRTELQCRGYGYVMDLADDAEVRAALAAAGFAGCRYQDMNPRNEREHDTILVWDTAVLSLVSADPITED